MDTWQAPAPAHRLSTVATWEWRPGSDLHPQPNIQQHHLTPDTPRGNFQVFSPFSTGAHKKQIALSGLDFTEEPERLCEPESSKPLSVLRHQSCPILIPKWLQLHSQTPPVPATAAAPFACRTQLMNQHSANEQEFVSPQLLDCCQLPVSTPELHSKISALFKLLVAPYSLF